MGNVIISSELIQAIQYALNDIGNHDLGEKGNTYTLAAQLTKELNAQKDETFSDWLRNQKQPIFAEREDMGKAWEYMDKVANACGPDNKLAVITSHMILFNTLLEFVSSAHDS